MKLDVGALLNSTFNTTTSNDTAWRAAMTLWCRAWHQVPGGSLPADDAALCHLAGLGRDLKTWKRIKAGALHGFTLCNDGRLYHGFLCKMAIEAHEEMLRFENRRQRDRERKSGGGSGGIPSETAVGDAALSSGIPAENTGQDQTRPISPKAPHRQSNRRRELPERTGSDEALIWRNRLSSGPAGPWLPSWGPRPDEDGCEAPELLVAGSPWRKRAA
ncbi:MAG: hypothetical protein WCJ64_22355 [Rhodospirillaceae bacterium]